MRYKAMAQHWLYERARAAIPSPEDGVYLEAQKEFTPAEHDKFVKAVNTELERMRERLETKGVIA